MDEATRRRLVEAGVIKEPEEAQPLQAEKQETPAAPKETKTELSEEDAELVKKIFEKIPERILRRIVGILENKNTDEYARAVIVNEESTWATLKEWGLRFRTESANDALEILESLPEFFETRNADAKELSGFRPSKEQKSAKKGRLIRRTKFAELTKIALGMHQKK